MVKMGVARFGPVIAPPKSTTAVKLDSHSLQMSLDGTAE